MSDELGDSVSYKPVNTKEAVAECDKINTSLFQILDYAGNYRRDPGKDCDQTWWSMTRDPKTKEKPKHIPNDHPFMKYMETLKDGHLNVKTLYEYFSSFDKKVKPQLSVIDTCTITRCGKKIDTTIGRYIFNKVVYEKLWDNKYFPYYNEVMFKDVVSDSFRLISQLCIEGKAKSDAVYRAVDLSTELGLRLGTVFNAGLTITMGLPDAKFDDFRNKKLEKIKQQVIETGDFSLLEKAEKEIIDFAKDYYKDDDMMEIFASKVKVKFNNEFKNLNICMGALPSLDGKPTFVFNSLTEGIDNEYLPELFNTGALGAVSRGLFTAKGGAMYKDIINSLQSSMGVRGDCGSTQGIEIQTGNKFDILNRYAIVGGKSVKITLDNVDKFLNKKIVVRTPSKCKMKGGHFCSHCVGDGPFDILGKDKIPLGILTAEVATGILNLFMKATHSLGAEMFVIDDLNKFLVPQPKTPIFEIKEDKIGKVKRIFCTEDIEWRLPISSVTAVDNYYAVLAHGSIVETKNGDNLAFVLGTEVYTNPSEVINPDEEVDDDLERHVIFRYKKGDAFLLQPRAEKKEMTVYKMFNLFLSGNASPTVPFETHLTTMKNTMKFNKKANMSDVSVEIILSSLARDPNDPNKPARETEYKNGYKFVSMYDLIVLGGMFNSCFGGDAVKSIFINMNKSEAEQTKTISPMEKALRY